MSTEGAHRRNRCKTPGVQGINKSDHPRHHEVMVDRVASQRTVAARGATSAMCAKVDQARLRKAQNSRARSCGQHLRVSLATPAHAQHIPGLTAMSRKTETETEHREEVGMDWGMSAAVGW